MSDVLKGQFSVEIGKVINKCDDLSAQSAIKSLLDPSANMFENANSIFEYMRFCKLTEEQVSQKLGIDERIVVHKLLLLKFTKTQRQIILQSGICEKCAIEIAKLFKADKAKVIKELALSQFYGKKAQELVYDKIKQLKDRQLSLCNKIASPQKIIIRDVGLFFNTVERAVKLMQSGGYEVQNTRHENEKEYRLDIKVKKNNKNN